MKNLLKLSISCLALIVATSASGQTVKTITEAEYEHLKANPDRMQAMKEKGIEIKVIKDEPAGKKKPVVVTKSEMAEIKKSREKYEAFMKSSNGNYEVIDDPVKPEAPAEPEPLKEKPATEVKTGTPK